MSFLASLRLGDLTAPLLAVPLAAWLTAWPAKVEPVNIGGQPRAAVVATVMLKGTAAQGGAVVAANVTVVDARGRTRATTTSYDGSFAIEVDDAAPYLLVLTQADGATWYSYAVGPGVANITPLTTLALLDGLGSGPLERLIDQWPSRAPTPERMLQASRKLNAQMLPLMRQLMADAPAHNVFTTAFVPDHKGIDGVHDRIKVAYRCDERRCNASYAIDAQPLQTWRSDMATADITLRWRGIDDAPPALRATAPVRPAGGVAEPPARSTALAATELAAATDLAAAAELPTLQQLLPPHDERLPPAAPGGEAASAAMITAQLSQPSQ